MSDGKLHVGTSKKTGDKIEIPVKTLRRHFAALGASGSGKTVFVKAVLEECIREGIPLLLIDIQGDLASLALMGDRKQVEDRGTPGSYYDEVKNNAQVAIFTPASTKGIPISMNPLKAPPTGLDREDVIQAIDSVAETIASLLAYNTEKGKGKDVHSYLYILLQAVWMPKNGVPEELDSFDDLIRCIENDQDYIEYGAELLSDKDKSDLKRQLKSLTIGSDSLIFNMGMPLDIEAMMNWADEGKTPVNVLYLNTIRDDETRMNFMADVATQTYNYMIKNPKEHVQLVLLFDELAGLVPPVGSPPTKKPIQLLLKQARKYGVSLLLATQNISDVDYKSLGQVGTWALGRLMAKQDIEKVKAIIEAISPAEVDTITTKLRNLKTGEFMLLAPDVFKEVQYMQVRWLVTNHTTLDDLKVKKVLDESGIKSKFDQFLDEQALQKPKDGGKSKDSKTTSKSSGEPLAEEFDLPEDDEVDDPAGIPILRRIEDVPIFLDKAPNVLSSEEISEQLNRDESEVDKMLTKYVDDKKLASEKIGTHNVYWSNQFKMDPKKNIVAPTFILQNRIVMGQATEIVDKEIPRDLGKRREEIQGNKTELIYVPLWRIGVIREFKQKEGSFFRKKEVWVTEKSIHYVNAVDGSIANYENKKEETVYFQTHEISDPSEVQSLPKSLINDRMQFIEIEKLRDIHKDPALNREDAIAQIRKILGGRVNTKIVPSLVWYPIFEFFKVDEAKEKKGWDGKSQAWVDGIFGTYYDEETSPLK